MAAYVVLQVDVHDTEKFEGYKALSPVAIASHGGRYLVRGGAVSILEGNWKPPRFVIIEFPSGAKAQAWWDSQEYAEAKKIRQACATSQTILAEGV